MTPQVGRAQALDEIDAVLRIAATGKGPVAAMYDGLPRLLCPHVLGRNKEGRLRAFCYQFGGSSGSGLRMVTKGPEYRACIVHLWWEFGPIETMVSTGIYHNLHRFGDIAILRNLLARLIPDYIVLPPPEALRQAPWMADLGTWGNRLWPE